MLKKLNRIWWNSLKQANKRQQRRTRTWLKAITAKPKRTASGNAAAATATSAQQPAPDGLWRSGYYTSTGIPARRMGYRLFVPAAAHATAMPLLVMLHGCQQNAADFAAGTRMNQLAAAKGYAVLYPEQSLRAHTHRCWKWYDAATQRGAGDTQVIAQMIDAIAAQHAIDRSRIYACGISAGAAMAQILAFTYPQLIAAVGLHSSPVFGTCRSATEAYGVMQHGSANALAPIRKLLAAHPDFPPMPAILIGGDDDRIVRPVNQMALLMQFKLLNAAAGIAALPPVTKSFGRISRQFPQKNTMQTQDFAAGPKVMIRSIHIGRLGHAWSGGDDHYAFHAKGPDAGKLVLAFFAKHRRSH